MRTTKSARIIEMLDTPTKYCEQILHTSIEPINAITNLAFVLLATLAFYKLRNKKGILRFILPFLLLCIGAGSTWWHMGHSAWGDVADTLSIIVFASTVSALLLYQLLGSTTKVAVAFVPLLLLTLVAEQQPYLNGSLPYIVLLVGLMVAGAFYVKKFPASRNLVVASVATFALAIVFRTLDMELCSHLAAGTHFLWHIFVALLGYQLILLATNKYATSTTR